LIQFLPCRRSWPDFVFTTSLHYPNCHAFFITSPFLCISFSIFFSLFVSVIPFLCKTAIRNIELSIKHCSCLFSKHDHTTAYCSLLPSYLKTLIDPAEPSTWYFFYPLALRHTSLYSTLFPSFSKLPSLFLVNTTFPFHTTKLL